MLLIGFSLVLLILFGFVSTDVINHTKENKNTNQKEVVKKYGPDCKVQYDRRCNFGNPINIFPGTITNPTDVANYCNQTSISCSTTECVARLNVLYGFLPGSPKPDSCLPDGYRRNK